MLESLSIASHGSGDSKSRGSRSRGGRGRRKHPHRDKGSDGGIMRYSIKLFHKVL